MSENEGLWRFGRVQDGASVYPPFFKGLILTNLSQKVDPGQKTSARSLVQHLSRGGFAVCSQVTQPSPRDFDGVVDGSQSPNLRPTFITT